MINIHSGDNDTAVRKSIRERRPTKSTVLTPPEKVAYLKRNQTRYDDAQNKKEKIIKKGQQSPQKETAAKRTKPK